MHHVATLVFRAGRAFSWLWMAGACCFLAIVVWQEFVAPAAAGPSELPRTLGQKLTMLGVAVAMLAAGMLLRVVLRRTEARMVALGVVPRAGEDGTQREAP